MKLRQANGALLDAPIYDNRPQATNYLAVIDIDGMMPGGLARRFVTRARGECLYLADRIDLFDAVEFAADWTTQHGNKRKDRWYGVVVAKTDDSLLVEKCSSGVNAVLRAKSARMSVADKIRALQAEREQLITRASAIEGEIAHLKGEPTTPSEEPAAQVVQE